MDRTSITLFLSRADVPMQSGRAKAVIATAILTMVVTLLGVAPATAGHGGIHPDFKTQSVYFECPGPIANSGTWREAAPGPASDGNGCGNLLNAGELGLLLCREAGVCYGRFVTVFVGSFAGNLRDLTVELHRVRSPNPAAGGLHFSISIDGRTSDLIGDAVASPSGLTDRYVASVPELNCASEDGVGSRVRHIRITISTDTTPWVWGASEFAAGITFNPSSLAQAQYHPTNPPACS